MMKFIYQNKEYSLAEFKEEQNAFEKELAVPDYLRKVEQLKLLGFDHGYCIAYEFFDDLYSQITSARYALLMGHKKLHDSNYIKWSSGEIGQYWIRYQFLKNSIVWYSASYEMLWQALWFGFFLFRKIDFMIKKKPVVFYDIESKDIYQQLLTLCTYPNLERALRKVSTDHSAILLKSIQKFHESKEQKRVRMWVNKLKHNGNLEAIELYYNDGIELEESKFNSSYTEPEVVAIDEMVNVLKGYHIKFCELTQYVYTFFDFASFIPKDRKVRRMDVREYKKIVIE